MSKSHHKNIMYEDDDGANNIFMNSIIRVRLPLGRNSPIIFLEISLHTNHYIFLLNLLDF